MMIPESIQEAILRHLEGESREEDDRLILSFLEESEENKQFFFDIKAIWAADRVLNSESLDSDYEAMLSRLNARIDAEQEDKPARPKHFFTKCLSIAASVAALLALAVFMFNDKSSLFSSKPVYVTHINQTGDIESVVMPDGTGVWLVAGSKLEYLMGENLKERDIILSGEGYFEVAKDSLRPFTLHANNISVVALGTSFNVRALPGSDYSEILLEEGSVVLKNSDGNNLVRLRPNQKATVRNTDNDIVISDMFASNFITTKYHMILLNDVTEEEIKKHLEEHFGVKINVSGKQSRKKYNISYRKTNTLGEVLEMLDFMTEKKWTASDVQ